ncbi:MAG: L-aspartate oxidase [Acidobacteriota bacterium]|nr:L-aspartate oxidase [Acidobacteriota bacterium]
MQRRTDFLVIGSGIAGLRAAADLAMAGDVLILTKADPAESNTGYAQGGIAAALGPGDSPSLHAADTIAAGDGLCIEPAVRVLVEDGVRYTRELIANGARFDREPSGELSFGREGAHGLHRVMHAADATGREIGRALWHQVAEHARVRVERHARVSRLLVRGGRCVGAAYENDRGTHVVEATAVLVATGGAGQVFRETTNPSIATGDGVTLAWQCGARVADMEFVQFHPTALSALGAPRFLLSEAMRGEGAFLVNDAGERFMTRYEPAGDLASRDLVSRAIVREQQRTGRPVYLSLQHLDPAWVRDRFPTIARACREAGFDLATDHVPVGPAAHYVMGGVETDLWGRTTIPGLLAAGEVACTGVHGANRLASNSLLEGLVFGARAAQAMLLPPEPGQLAEAVRVPMVPMVPKVPKVRPPNEGSVRELMWTAVGLMRERSSLEAAIHKLDAWYAAVVPGLEAGGLADADWRVASIVTVGRLMAHAALRREETRGGHARTDFPARDDVNFKVHIVDKNPVVRLKPDTT